MTLRDPEFGATLDTTEVATITGLPLDAFDPAQPIQIVSTGTAFAIVPLRSAEALAYLNVRQAAARSYLRARGARWFYVLGPEDPTSSMSRAGASAAPSPTVPWRSRMQFEGGEDPATGSAAGCAISYLVRQGIVGPDTMVHLRQGIEIQRPSELFLRASLAPAPSQTSVERKVTNVRVGGSTVLVASGNLFLP